MVTTCTATRAMYSATKPTIPWVVWPVMKLSMA